ncbi:hypothetical protein YpB42003004_4041 [Yersinia pestis biovar Antiqua str. B42003004]|nr:hypothetical protein YpB42003004_4041 [Yersinia pestis biovar Antiqua str. B42003004]
MVPITNVGIGYPSGTVVPITNTGIEHPSGNVIRIESD